jgi:transcriptional regulator with XRE-family HTH domain
MAKSTQGKVDNRLSELKSNLATRLKDVLSQQNLNQSELAERTGRKVSYINRVLRGATNITFESIARMEIALGMALIEMPETFEWLNSRRMPGDVEMKIRTSGAEASAVMPQPSILEQQ